MVPGLPRRQALGLLAATGAAGLAGCSGPRAQAAGPVAGLVPDEVPHPALVTPGEAGHLALLRLPDGPDRARVALLAVARAVARHQRRGAAVTLGIGPGGLARAGLTDAIPAGLGPMPPFAGDVLDQARTEPDLLLLLEQPSGADAADTLLAEAPGLTVGWRVEARREPAGQAGGRALMRNPFGFVEGQSNPAPADAVTTATVTGGGLPAWADGGGYLALRVVRLALAAWQHDSPARQRAVIGRRPDGRWLDGSPAQSPAPFNGDPSGSVTPLDAHVRLANPDPAARVRLLRRSWQYDAGRTAAGQPDQGLLFLAHTADLRRFETVQRRLAGEPLSRYSLAVGGGYFFVPRRDRAGERRPSWAEQL